MPQTTLDNLIIDKLPTDKSSLFRVWRYPGGDWEPSPRSGNGRADCPKIPPAYHLLYCAMEPIVALQETRLLTESGDDGWLFHQARASDYRITEYVTAGPLAAATLDAPNAQLLGLQEATLFNAKELGRAAVSRIWDERSGDVDAVYWRSKHREEIGKVVAVFHDKKEAVGLRRVASSMLLDHSVMEQLQNQKIIKLM